MPTAKEAFKIGVLTKFAELGLTMEESLHEVQAAIVKVAGATNRLHNSTQIKRAFPGEALLNKPVQMAGDAVTWGANTVKNMGLGAMIGLPLVAGAGLGIAGAKLRGLDDEDPDEIKTKELIDEYDRATYQAKLRRASKNQQGFAMTPSGRPLLR